MISSILAVKTKYIFDLFICIATDGRDHSMSQSSMHFYFQWFVSILISPSTHNPLTAISFIIFFHFSYTPATAEVTCYNIIQPSSRSIPTLPPSSCILSSELVLPSNNDMHVSRSHCALHMLASLDTLTAGNEAGMVVVEAEKERQSIARVYTKEDFNTVTRFEG